MRPHGQREGKGVEAVLTFCGQGRMEVNFLAFFNGQPLKLQSYMFTAFPCPYLSKPHLCLFILIMS